MSSNNLKGMPYYSEASLPFWKRSPQKTVWPAISRIFWFLPDLHLKMRSSCS